MAPRDRSYWSRRFVLASAGFLLLWQAGELLGIPRRTGVFLGLFGFVLHMVFGKGYSLIPAYFNRQLRLRWAPPVHLLLSVAGTLGLALASVRSMSGAFESLAALAWTLGVGVFLLAILWSVRDNLTGAETGTGPPNADRRRVDRFSNAFIPVAMAYLALGSYETLAAYSTLPGVYDGSVPRISHLLAAGTAAGLVLALGFRLLPRFLVVTPPWPLVLIVLPAGSVGPFVLATDFGGGWWFRIGAVIEAVAVLGFAAAYLAMFRRSERARVGFSAVLLGVASGSAAVLLGLWFAFGEVTGGSIQAHFRLNVLGFLGLTIVGVAYQFYPPAVGSFRWTSDRTAMASILAIGGGVFLEAGGLIGGLPPAVVLGRAVALGGAIVYAALIAALFRDRYG